MLEAGVEQRLRERLDRAVQVERWETWRQSRATPPPGR
jgi:hypothetical protein